MSAHDVFLDWVYDVNKGKTKGEYPLLSYDELKELRAKESAHIKNAKITIENGKTIIQKLWIEEAYS